MHPELREYVDLHRLCAPYASTTRDLATALADSMLAGSSSSDPWLELDPFLELCRNCTLSQHSWKQLCQWVLTPEQLKSVKEREASNMQTADPFEHLRDQALQMASQRCYELSRGVPEKSLLTKKAYQTASPAKFSPNRVSGIWESLGIDPSHSLGALISVEDSDESDLPSIDKLLQLNLTATKAQANETLDLFHSLKRSGYHSEAHDLSDLSISFDKFGNFPRLVARQDLLVFAEDSTAICDQYSLNGSESPEHSSKVGPQTASGVEKDIDWICSSTPNNPQSSPPREVLAECNSLLHEGLPINHLALWSQNKGLRKSPRHRSVSNEHIESNERGKTGKRPRNDEISITALPFQGKLTLNDLHTHSAVPMDSLDGFLALSAALPSAPERSRSANIQNFRKQPSSASEVAKPKEIDQHASSILDLRKVSLPPLTKEMEAFPEMPAIVSIRLLQNFALHVALQEEAFNLIEVDLTYYPQNEFEIYQPDLIVGPNACVLLVNLNTLPGNVIGSNTPIRPNGRLDRQEALFTTITRLSRTYDHILILLQKPAWGEAFTPPVCKAQRELYQANERLQDEVEASGEGPLKVTVKYPENEKFAARLIRQFTYEIYNASGCSPTDTLTSSLDADESQDERDLIDLGLSPWMARVILREYSFEELLQMKSSQRFQALSEYIGKPRMDYINRVIGEM